MALKPENNAELFAKIERLAKLGKCKISDTRVAIWINEMPHVEGKTFVTSFNKIHEVYNPHYHFQEVRAGLKDNGKTQDEIAVSKYLGEFSSEAKGNDTYVKVLLDAAEEGLIKS